MRAAPATAALREPAGGRPRIEWSSRSRFDELRADRLGAPRDGRTAFRGVFLRVGLADRIAQGARMSGIPAVGARVEVHYRRSVENDSPVDETLVPAAPAVGVLCVPPPLQTNPYQHLLYQSVAPYGLRLVSGVLKV